MLFIQSLCYGSTSTTLKLEMEKIVIITATLTHQFIFFETILILEFLYKLSYNVPEDGFSLKNMCIKQPLMFTDREKNSSRLLQILKIHWKLLKIQLTKFFQSIPLHFTVFLAKEWLFYMRKFHKTIKLYYIMINGFNFCWNLK